MIPAALAMASFSFAADVVPTEADRFPEYRETDTRHYLNLAAGGLRQRRFEWTKADWWLAPAMVAASGAMVVAVPLSGGTPDGSRSQLGDLPLLAAAGLPLLTPVTLRRGWDGGGGRRYWGRHAIILESVGAGVASHLVLQSARCAPDKADCATNWGVDGLAVATLSASTTSWLNVALIGRHEHGWSGVRGWQYQLGPLALSSTVAGWQVHQCNETVGCEVDTRAAVQGVAVGWLAGMLLPHLHRGGLLSTHRTWSDARDRRTRDRGEKILGREQTSKTPEESPVEGTTPKGGAQ